MDRCLGQRLDCSGFSFGRILASGTDARASRESHSALATPSGHSLQIGRETPHWPLRHSVNWPVCRRATAATHSGFHAWLEVQLYATCEEHPGDILFARVAPRLPKWCSAPSLTAPAPRITACVLLYVIHGGFPTIERHRHRLRSDHAPGCALARPRCDLGNVHRGVVGRSGGRSCPASRDPTPSPTSSSSAHWRGLAAIAFAMRVIRFVKLFCVHDHLPGAEARGSTESESGGSGS